MKLKTLLLISVCIAIFDIVVCAQTVTITPRKTIYKRPKPESKYKRTFSIRRPLANAATPALSAKITRTIDPIRVLDIRLRDELVEYQWLEEADFKVLFNRNNVLCVELWMTGTAAYPDRVTKTVVVDARTGEPATIAKVFEDLPGLAAMARRSQEAEVRAAKNELKKDPDADPEALFAETKFTVEDLNEFAVDSSGVTILYDYGFPHVLEALQPDGRYKFTWTQIKPFIRSDGLLASFVR